MGIEATLKGLVGRLLPAPFPDGTPQGARLGRYGEVMCITPVRKQHALAEEGSYFVVNNGQTGIANAAAPTSFSATNPFVLINNSDSPDNAYAKRIFLDYAMLLATAAGTAGASVQVAVTLDSIARYTSGGSNLTPLIVSPNMSVSARASVANVYAGNITAVAASGAVRTIVGNRYLKGAIPVIGDEFTMNFGGVEQSNTIQISTIMKSVVDVPPVIIGPGQSCLIHLWLPSQSAASSYAPELAWWER